MFILATPTPPANADALTLALSNALAAIFNLPSNRKCVTIQSSFFPSIESVTVDLSGASVDPTRLPPKPEQLSAREKGPVVAQFKLMGQPISYQKAGINLNLAATNVLFDYARDEQQRLLLVPSHIESGELRIDVRHADLEALILAGAQLAAAPHGVNIQRVQLTASSLGSRSAKINLRIVAKKLFITATIRITGQLEIDELLNASLNNLSCEGDGVVGSIATGLLRPKLQQIDGKTFPLMAFSLGDTKLQAIQFTTSDPLSLRASFGS